MLKKIWKAISGGDRVYAESKEPIKNDDPNFPYQTYLAETRHAIPEHDHRFFMQIASSGTIEGANFVRLRNGDIIFGLSGAEETSYTPTFEAHQNAFEALGLKRECFGTAFDALRSYHHENCYGAYLKKLTLCLEEA